MSTGWYAIGTSPTRVLTDDPERPIRFAIGDTVEFRAIELSEMDARCRVSTR
jgi:inhibitor of KinA